MRGHPPRRGWRDNPNLAPGQRAVCLWEELTGRLATGQDRGLLKAIARETQEPEALLAWAVRHWNLVGDGVMDGADDYPAEPSLLWLRRNLADYQRAFSMDQRDLQFLASSEAREGRREWRKGHRKSDWRDDDSWRDSPHASIIEKLLATGKQEEARVIIRALGEAWRRGPHAKQIERLLLGVRVEEAEALVEASKESWRTGPNAYEIERLHLLGRDEEAEALRGASRRDWRDGPHAEDIKMLYYQGRDEDIYELVKQANAEEGGEVVYLPNAEPRRRVRPGRRGSR